MIDTLTLDKLKIWFYRSSDKNMYRIRRNGVTRSCIAEQTEELTKDVAFAQLLADWDILAEGTYDIDIKKSKQGAWSQFDTFSKNTPSASAIGVMNGIGNTMSGNNHVIDNKAFDFATAQISLLQTELNAARQREQDEREKRRDAEQALMLEKVKRKGKKSSFDKLLKGDGIAGIIKEVGTAFAKRQVGAAIGTVTSPEKVDATIEPTLDDAEQLQQQRAMRRILEAVTGMSRACPDVDFIVILESFENAAIRDPSAFKSKIQTALTFL